MSRVKIDIHNTDLVGIKVKPLPLGDFIEAIGSLIQRVDKLEGIIAAFQMGSACEDCPDRETCSATTISTLEPGQKPN